MTAEAMSGAGGSDAALEMVRRMIAEAPVLMALFDGDRRCIAVSGGWLRQFGQEAGRWIGQRPEAMMPSGEGGWLAALEGAFRGHAASGVERFHQPPQGPDQWMTWKVWPVDPGRGWVAASLSLAGGPGGWVFDPRAASPTVEEITSTLGIGLLEHDFQTGVTVVTDSYLALLGLRREELPKSDAEWISLLRLKDPDGFRASRVRALDPAGDGLLSVEVWPVVAGVERWMQIKSHVMFEGEGADRRPRHLVGILIDRTEEWRMQEALGRAQRLESVGRIAGMVAHDFNNILSVILGNLELVEPKVADGAARGLVRNAIEATQMGAGFNRRLLTLAGGNGGAAATFHLDRHLGETWEIFWRILRDDILLQFEPGAGEAHVHADPAEVDAALLNLVVNARDAQADGGRIVITTQVIGAAEAGLGTGDDPFVRITVADDGDGMAPEVAVRAGEPFFTTKPLGMGSGLGLTSVIMMAERIGGAFRLETGAEGTRASILLPVHAAEVAGAADRTEDIPMGAGEVVLVVEDDPLVREAAMQRLEALGYVVCEASTVQGAVDLLESGGPVHLVFSDIVLPGGASGIDLIDRVRQGWPRIGVLLTSGHASTQYRGAHVHPGLPEILRKPYSLRELAFAMRRGLSPPG